ncbi:MAG: universal stress protein [Azospira oryzae]|nr:MAG: universal stress protein [Azospira oryzae]PZP80743.1 MAG: universal stress protein [Azospira oryzae]
MYTHLLLPTDGSALSEAAIQAGVTLAKSLGARVTGLYVKPALPPHERLDLWEPDDAQALRRMEELAEQRSQRYLSVIEAAAAERDVPCECVSVSGTAPFEEIIRVARERGCDLIFMASHGRKGVAGLLLGSETVKVLTHAHIPVLVHRAPARS